MEKAWIGKIRSCNGIDKARISLDLLSLRYSILLACDYLLEQDCMNHLRPYVIYVPDLPIGVTSKELSRIFEVHVAQILVRPGFNLEKYHMVHGHSSSEAWIKEVGQEVDVRKLASRKSGEWLHGCQIRCEVILEPIEEQELCKHFEKGLCRYNPCHYKHYQCSEQDTCENVECRLGHSKRRKTVSKTQSKEGKSTL